MNKSLVLVVLLSIFCIASVSAEVTVNNDVYYGLITDAGLQKTTTPVTQVSALGYICNNASCTQLASSLWNAQTSGNTNRLAFTYPTTPQYSANAGYGIYLYKPGYVTVEQFATWYGEGTAPDTYNNYLAKVDVCRSTIDTFEVINDVYANQPVMIDITTSLNANAYAALKHAGPLDAVPSSLTSYYTVLTRVTLEILNQQGQVVSTQYQDVEIPFSAAMRVQFDWLPSITGRFTARVSTTVLDDVCLSTDKQFSQKDFNVINQAPKEMCYTQLQNLSVSPTTSKVNEQLTFGVQKIANYYDSFGNLFPLTSTLVFSVIKDGTTISTQQITSPANNNIKDYKSVSFTYTPTTAGYYTFTVTGNADSCPYNNAIADVVSLGVVINDNQVQPINNAPTWNQIPTKVLAYNSGNQQVYNLQNYAIDADNDQITYIIEGQTNPSVTQCTLVANNVLCTASTTVGCSTIKYKASDATSFTQTAAQVCVQQQNVAPVLSVLPSITLQANNIQQTNIINLPVYASDADGDAISFAIATQTNPAAATCEINTQRGLDCTGKAQGISDVVIVASDGILVSSQSVRVVVTGNQVSTITTNFPEVNVAQNSGLNKNVLYLPAYVTSTPVLPVTFKVISQTNTNLVDCYLDGDYMDCIVKNNVGTSLIGLEISNGLITKTAFISVVVSTSTTGTSGVCGGAAKDYTQSQTQFNGPFCSSGNVVGNPQFPSANAPTQWMCLGSNGGGSATCMATRTAQQTVVNGACGTAAKAYDSQATQFSGNFCSSGYLTAATNQEATSISFKINGVEYTMPLASSMTIGDLVVESSQALIIEDATLDFVASLRFLRADKVQLMILSRGGYVTIYMDEAVYTVELTKVTTNPPQFPSVGNFANWYCAGINGGTDSLACTATNGPQLQIVVPDQTIIKNTQTVIVDDLSAITTNAQQQEVTYTLTQTSGSELGTCQIVANSIACTPAANKVGTMTFTITANTATLSAQDDFTVMIKNAYTLESSRNGQPSSTRIMVSNFELPNLRAGERELPITFSVIADGKSVDKARISISIPDLGVYRSLDEATIRQSQSITRNILLDIPANTKPGVYTVRLTIQGDNGYRVVHRDFVVQ